MKAQSTRFLKHLCSGGTLDTQAEVVCLVILANLTENIRGSGDGDYATALVFMDVLIIVFTKMFSHCSTFFWLLFSMREKTASIYHPPLNL